MAGEVGIEPTNDGVKVRCLTTWLLPNWGERWDSNPRVPEPQSGALTASPRPPYLNHWQGRQDSNPRHAVLETAVLPAELRPYVVVRNPVK